VERLKGGHGRDTTIGPSIPAARRGTVGESSVPENAGSRPSKGRRAAPRAGAPAQTDADNWDARLGFLMHDVSRLRRAVFDEFVKPIGLTRSQWWILAQVSRHDGMNQSDLAHLLDVGKAALGRLVDRLEASGFIERRSDASDRRVKRVYLTRRGAKTIEEMKSLSHEMSERMLKGLDAKARHALAESLAVVKANLIGLKGDSAVEGGED
jgi:DNA-binding MarR family transcriptional regulator